MVNHTAVHEAKNERLNFENNSNKSYAYIDKDKQCALELVKKNNTVNSNHLRKNILPENSTYLPFSEFKDGHFVWDSEKQGHVLGSYYYGYSSFQV
jgi:hypothetical protein